MWSPFDKFLRILGTAAVSAVMSTAFDSLLIDYVSAGILPSGDNRVQDDDAQQDDQDETSEDPNNGILLSISPQMKGERIMVLFLSATKTFACFLFKAIVSADSEDEFILPFWPGLGFLTEG